MEWSDSFRERWKRQSMSTQSHFRNKVTLLSFLCSLCVIIGHAENTEVYGLNEQSAGFAGFVYAFEKFTFETVKLSIPIFFMISGYLFFRNYTLAKTKEKYVSRFRSVVIPYIFWCTFYYLVFIVLGRLPGIGSQMNSAPKELSLIGWIRCFTVSEYYSFWFLKNLILFILVHPLIYVLLLNRDRLPIGTAVLMLFLFNGYYKVIAVPSGLETYLFGSWAAINYRELTEKRSVLLGGAGLLYIIAVFGTRLEFLNIFTEILLLISFWFLADRMDLSGVSFPWWMRISFFVYVFHDLVLEAYEKIFLLVFGRSPAAALADMIVVPVLVFATVAAVAAVLRKYLPDVWSFITGGRNTSS